MAGTVVMKVAWAIRRSSGKKAGRAGIAAPQDQEGGEPPLDATELEIAGAAVNACFDEIWSDGFLVGSKCGPSGMNPELLRVVARGYILGRPRGFGSVDPGGAALPGEAAADPEVNPSRPTKPPRDRSS